MNDTQPVPSLPVAGGISGGDYVIIVTGGTTKIALASHLFATGQTAHATLTALAGLSAAGWIKFNGSGDVETIAVTSAGQAFVTAADVTAQKALLSLGTASTKAFPASGNAASGEVVLGSDTRLTDSRTPTTHAHSAADITSGILAAARGGAGSTSGILKANGSGAVSAATAGTDYLSPSGSGASLTALNATQLTSGTVPIARIPTGTSGSTVALGNHTHLAADITNLGTAATKDTPSSGNAGVGEIVLGSDTRLSDARTPASHTHTLSAVTDAGTAAARDVPASGNATSTQCVLGSDTRLGAAATPLAHASSHAAAGSDPITPNSIGAAAASHTHTVSQITDAGSAATKAAPSAGVNANSVQVVMGDDTRLTDTRTPASHNHSGSEITSGTVAFARLPTGTSSSTIAIGDHTHTFASLTSKPATLAGYGISDAAAASHTHTLSSITDAGTMASQAASAVAITGGTINGAVIGGTTPAAIKGTEVQATTSIKLNGGGFTATITGTFTANRAQGIPDEEGVYSLEGSDIIHTASASLSIVSTEAKMHRLTLDIAGTALTFTGHTTGRTFYLLVTQDGTGSRTINWHETIFWEGGTDPTLTTTGGQSDLLMFVDMGNCYIGKLLVANCSTL